MYLLLSLLQLWLRLLLLLRGTADSTSAVAAPTVAALNAALCHEDRSAAAAAATELSNLVLDALRLGCASPAVAGEVRLPTDWPQSGGGGKRRREGVQGYVKRRTPTCCADNQFLEITNSTDPCRDCRGMTVAPRSSRMGHMRQHDLDDVPRALLVDSGISFLFSNANTFSSCSTFWFKLVSVAKLVGSSVCRPHPDNVWSNRALLHETVSTKLRVNEDRIFLSMCPSMSRSIKLSPLLEMRRDHAHADHCIRRAVAFAAFHLEDLCVRSRCQVRLHHLHCGLTRSLP